ncbi:MAG: segregation/condensation protein A [Erysipelotrichaceae bacterium]|nr:segregation/condensation protein A [Erysipelotrichaceae bacterium]
MSFVVTIDKFDGPLDLMIHLIKEKDLDIFDLDISQLADQYIDYIHQMQQMRLDVASEYLSELAGLIEYKSKKLLPAQESELVDDYEEQKMDLVQRLIEYQKYKEITAQFDQLYKERALMHDKVQSEIANDWINGETSYQETSPYELIKAMKRVLNRYAMANPYEVSIATQRTTAEEREKQLVKRYRSYDDKKSFTLTEMMDDCKDAYDVVVTFLAVLNMVNNSYLVFAVRDDEVYFRKGVNYE